jgi:hypothetical protein
MCEFKSRPRHIDAKTKVIKAFGGIDDLSKLSDIIVQTEEFTSDDLESFQTLSLDEAKAVSKDSSGAMIDLSQLKETVAVKAKVAKAAKDNGLTVASQLSRINSLSTDELKSMRETKLDDLVVAVKAVGADALADVANLKSVADTIKESGADAVLKELNNVILKDAKGLPLVIQSGDRYVWSSDVTKGRVFHGVFSDFEDGEGELGVFRIAIDTKGNAKGLDIMGGDYGDNWEETFVLQSDQSILKGTEYDENGNPEEVFFIRVLKGADGKLVLGTVSFEADDDLDDYEIARGELPFSKLDTVEGKARIALLGAATTEADLIKNYMDGSTVLFGTEADALKRYNTLFDANAKVELKDENGKAIVVSMGSGDDIEYYWARELNGVKMRTAVGSQNDSPGQEIINATATGWTSGSDSGTYSNKGKVIVTSEVIEGVTETSYHRIIKDSNGFRMINITRTDGKNPWDADEELWDKFLWWGDSYWADTVVPGVDGSGNWQNGGEIEYIAGTASEATALYNLLLDLWHNDDPNRKDTDGDGVPDYKDTEPNKGTVTDHDGDGIKNEADINYPGNENKTDADNNGVVDTFDSDADGDGVIDALDAFANDASETKDSDNDKVGDNADFFPNDAKKWNNNPTLKNNGQTAISGWSDLEKQSLQKYINGKYTDEASRNALAASIELLEWAMTNRTISNESNHDHLNQGVFIDQVAGFRNLDGLNWDLPQVQNMIGLLQEMHMIGDSKANNKDMIQNLLTTLSDSTALKNFTSEADANTVLTEDFGPVLDALLGTQRGRIDDEQSIRKNDLHEPLDLDNKEKNVRDGKTYKVGTVNQRALVGHTNKISGVIDDDDLNVQEVDLTIIASGRDTIIGHSDIDGDGVVDNGEIKDLLIKAPVTAKEDVYVIAAADELYLRGEWSSENSQSLYANPEPLDIEVQNSSLALASVDEMNLVDVDITTGGSLAIASLDEINIWSTGNSGFNEFTVGADADDDFEGLFLYAQHLIEVNGLNVQGRVDDIYMEAYTINLSNVTFPSSSAVLLRSELGGLNVLNSGDTATLGNVNLNNVTHLGIKGDYLLKGDFSPNPSGGYQTKPNSKGRPYMKVESYK